jgi:hypothetical protein
VVGTLVRIGYSAAIILVAEGLVAIISHVTFDGFRLLVGLTSILVLVGAALAWLSGPGPKVWGMAGALAYPSLSSGTKPLWDTNRPLGSDLSQGTLLVAFGTGLVLVTSFLLMRFFP